MAPEPAKRTWTIEADASGFPDDREVFQMHQDLAVIMTKIGGSISGVAVRRQAEDGLYVTVGYVYRWESFAPVERAAPEPVADEPQAEAEPELEPAPA